MSRVVLDFLGAISFEDENDDKDAIDASI